MGIFHYIDLCMEAYCKQLCKPKSTWPLDIQRGLKIFNNHLFLPECSVSLIKALNKTPQNNFSLRFRRYVGMTPEEYMLTHRIEAAKMLLADGYLKEVPVSDIGYAVGYEKASSFAMAFTRISGISPGRWRDRG